MPMKTQAIITHNMSMYRYHFTTKDPFPITDRMSTSPYNDPTCIWFKNLQKPTTNKARFITFGRTDYVISNWSGDVFPNVIYICMDGQIGFFDINGLPTDRVAAL